MSTQEAPTYSLPTTLHPPDPALRKSWPNRLPSSFLPTSSSSAKNDDSGLERERTNFSERSKHTPKWWKIRLFRGMINDVKRRAPFYWSDWVDVWDYRVVPATVYMYFAKYVPLHVCFFVHHEIGI
jgi:hypothetical protein